jgi:hypothetical protein
LRGLKLFLGENLNARCYGTFDISQFSS